MAGVRTGMIWTEKECNHLRATYLKKSDEKLAKELKRTVPAIMVKRSLLGLKRHKFYTYAKYIVRRGFQERNTIISLNKKVSMMKELIAMAEVETNRYKLDKIKEQLKKLSGL